ncbi:MAG: lytic transglycosylase domain-containing protein [Mycobacterium leprae]
MLRRLRQRRRLWAALAASLMVAPALLGGHAAAGLDGNDQLPPPERNPQEALPPDPAAMEAARVLAQSMAIADLAPAEYRMLVIRTADRHRIDPRLIASLVTVETEWDTHLVGSHGERGLMQLLPDTGAFLAKEAGLTQYDLADPATNLELGCLYLAALLQEYGTPERALAAYNGGPRAADQAATNPYARKVLSLYHSTADVPVRPWGNYHLPTAA